jgi:hypothetical protein
MIVFTWVQAAAAVIAAVAGRRTLAQLVPSLQLPVNPTGFSLARSMLRSAPPGLAAIPASASAASLRTMTQPGSSTVAVTQRATFVLRPPPAANGTASVLSMAAPPRAATRVQPSMLWVRPDILHHPLCRTSRCIVSHH